MQLLTLNSFFIFFIYFFKNKLIENLLSNKYIQIQIKPSKLINELAMPIAYVS